jgi:hypothetical protein
MRFNLRKAFLGDADRSNEALATPAGVSAAGEARRVAANIAQLPPLLQREE